MANSYDLAQTSFIFSWVSNFSSYAKGDSQNLAQYVKACLQTENVNPFPHLQTPHITDNPDVSPSLYSQNWKLVWGPGVFSINQRALNTAYIVESQDYYVLAIAGTDPHSIKDWMQEDFNVGEDLNITWSAISSNINLDLKKNKVKADELQSQISFGTALGIQRLVTQLTASDGSTLNMDQFFQNIVTMGGKKSIIVTGHSLGGALAPTIARYITDRYPEKFNQILAMPVAGPTPGNAGYQKDWDAIFQPTSVSGAQSNVNYFNENVFCTADVVPHAWEYITDYPVQVDPNNQLMYTYFQGRFEDLQPVIMWPAGKITDLALIAELGALVLPANHRGKVAHMKTAKHIIGFNFDEGQTSYLPVQSDGNAKITTLTVNPSPTGFGKFLENIGMIHVWSYGQTAFNIGIDFWAKINPVKVES